VKLESSAMIEPIRFRIVMGHPMYIYKPIQTLALRRGRGPGDVLLTGGHFSHTISKSEKAR
jgi:hypothetical protein